MEINKQELVIPVSYFLTHRRGSVDGIERAIESLIEGSHRTTGTFTFTITMECIGEEK